MEYRLGSGCCQMKKNGFKNCTSKKLAVMDWLSDIAESRSTTDFVEVQFKNTRKGYYLNNLKIPLEKGDLVAVEVSPGHDIGEVTLTGELVLKQMLKNGIDPKNEIRRIYRKARQSDIERYQEAKKREHATMIRAREIAEELKLNMKIGDVEFLGDGNKAIFYYIADERVDFRKLIKVFIDTFHIRVEMKQIGVRQEAGRIGAIGPCGRELCCSTWMSSFASVATSAARVQDIANNPQRLAGQCTKLKCCMNFELDTYLDLQKDFPPKETVLETKDASFFHFKTDVFKRQITYSSSKQMAANLVTISVERVKEIIEMNKKGEKPHALSVEEKSTKKEAKPIDYQNVVGQDSISRFDKNRKKRKNKNRGKNRDKENSQKK